MAGVSMMDPLGLLDVSAYGAMPSMISPAVMAGVSPSNSSTDEYDFLEDGEAEDDFVHAVSNIFGTSVNSTSSSHLSTGADSPTFAGANGADGEGEEGSNKKRGRRPPSTAAKRATHNAVERARRESLNSRFTYLAQQLPMHDVKRASKNAIVEKAIEFVASASHRERQLVDENTSLLTELNQLRARLGMPTRSSIDLTPAPSSAPSSRKKKTSTSGPSATPASAPPAIVQVAPAASAPASASMPFVHAANMQQQQQDLRRSISPRTVPTSMAQTQSPCMAPAQPTSIIQAAAQQQRQKSADAAAVHPAAASAPMFMPSYDWHMAAAQHYAGMDSMAFNPFAFADPQVFTAAAFQQPQSQPQQQQAPQMTMPTVASAPQFWAQYAQHQAAMPFATVH